MKAFIGIDPGANGAMVAILETGEVKILRFGKCTDKEIYEFANDLAFDYECFCILEKVHSMPGQGVSSTFTFGNNFGFIRGILTATRIRFDDKAPRVWQKVLGITPRVTGKKEGETEESKTEFKRRVREKAEQLFPEVKMTNDIADALLIAEFTRRTHV